MDLFKLMLALPAILLTFLLSGCAATQLALEHKNLETQSQMSETVFLDPVPVSQKTIYVSVHNTTDKAMKITSRIRKTLKAKGYRVVSNPNRAHYLLQSNILKVGKMSKSAAQSIAGSPYGSAIGGAAVGAAMTGSGQGAVAGSVMGGLIGLAANSLVKDVNYAMVTDIQISERVKSGVRVAEDTESILNNGTATTTHQLSHRNSAFRRYRTRIVSTADKVNLKFAQAKPELEKALAQEISGIF